MQGAVVRALIVLLAASPSLGTLILFPHSGVVTDAYAASDGWLAPLVGIVGFLLSAALERWALGRWEGLAAAPFYAAAIASTVQLPLTQRGVDECAVQCVLHRVAVAVLGVAETGLLWSRGFGTITISVTAVAIVSTVSIYLVAVQDGGANVSAAEMEELLKLTGTFELLLLLWVRLLAASVPTSGFREVVDLGARGEGAGAVQGQLLEEAP